MVWLRPPYDVQEVSDFLLHSPANVKHLMPKYNTVTVDKAWLNSADFLFHYGPQYVRFLPKPGIDFAKSYRHIAAILGSRQPKHEHKLQAVAFLLSHWFDDVLLLIKCEEGICLACGLNNEKTPRNENA